MYIFYLDERRITLYYSWVHHHITSTLKYTTYIQKLIFYLNYTHTVNSSKSQIQTGMTLRMDDRTGKYSAKGLRTDAQRTTANIHVGGVEKLFLSGVFRLLLSAIEE